MQEIDVMRRQNDFDYLLIKDDTFTIRRSRVIEFCKAIKTRHPDLRWHCLANVNTVDKSLLAEMREAGLHDMLYGIESGNPQILINTMKGTTIKRAREAIEACDELGIRTYGSFIFGLPGETYQTIEETIEFACSLPLTLAGFCILIPYPGTKVYDDYLQHVKKEDINYKDFLSTTGIHTVKGYDGAVDIDLSKLPEYIALAQRRFYVRPQQILRMVRGATPSIIKGYCKGLMALIHKEIYLLKLGFAKGKIKTTEGFVEESK